MMNFAMSAGTNVKLYNFLIAVMIAVIIVLAMNLVGFSANFGARNFPCALEHEGI